MQYKVGDRAVYPAHGVGVIKAIETREVEDVTATFYILKINDNGMTIMVPIQNADANGMRDVIEPSFVEQIYEVLRDRDTPIDTQTWNRRYREYMAKIKTGDPLEVAMVLRDLALTKIEKSLSFGERKMFDQAHTLLVQEIAASRGVDEASVEAEIDELFNASEALKSRKRK